jgi:hypothetical protein
VNNSGPRISFLIIVLNGEPFTKYCLRSLYPFAHQIVVVEGAAPGASGFATPQGHSSDGTLEALHRFKEDEDEENKVRIIVRDGFWREKDEMSRAGAEQATGDYLWQVDIDEFYKPEHMNRVLDMLGGDPGITAVSFSQIQFWGGFSYYVDGWYLRRGGDHFHRLFRWGTEYKYTTHRPPTVINEHAVDTRSIKWISGYELRLHGIFLYHYSLVFPKQVMEKSEYYDKSSWTSMSNCRQWADDVFTNLRRPLRIHNVPAYPGWLERFRDTHPPQIQNLQLDLESGQLRVQTRPTDDIEKLLRSPGYRLAKSIIRRLTPPLPQSVRLDRSSMESATPKSATTNCETSIWPTNLVNEQSSGDQRKPPSSRSSHESLPGEILLKKGCPPDHLPKTLRILPGFDQLERSREMGDRLSSFVVTMRHDRIGGRWLQAKGRFSKCVFLRNLRFHKKMLRLLRNPNATPFLMLEKLLNWLSTR